MKQELYRCLTDNNTMQLTPNISIDKNDTLHLKAVDENKIMAAIIDADLIAMSLPNTQVFLNCFDFTIALPTESSYREIYREYKKWKQSKTE